MSLLFRRLNGHFKFDFVYVIPCTLHTDSHTFTENFRLEFGTKLKGGFRSRTSGNANDNLTDSNCERTIPFLLKFTTLLSLPCSLYLSLALVSKRSTFLTYFTLCIKLSFLRKNPQYLNIRMFFWKKIFFFH